MPVIIFVFSFIVIILLFSAIYNSEQKKTDFDDSKERTSLKSVHSIEYTNINVRKPPSSSTNKVVYEPLPETFPIDISNFTKTETDEVYDIPFSLRYLAYNSVETINIILMQASNLVADFPETVLFPEDVNFQQQNPDVREHTFLTYHPHTNSGKIAKYPYAIYFHNNESVNSGTCLFGTVYHLVDGRIGKIHLVRWYKNVLYTINAGIKRGSLQVVKIEKSEFTDKKTLYNYNAK